MPLFIPLNNIDANNSNQAVEEPNMHKTNNKKPTAKYTIITLIKLLDSIPKE